jgi:hypothetical protein
MPNIPSLNTQNEEWLHKSFFARVAIRDYESEYIISEILKTILKGRIPMREYFLSFDLHAEN